MATKKPIKRSAPAVKKVPVAQPEMQTPCGCGCHHHHGRCLKKLIIAAIIFGAGYATCHFVNCDKGMHKFRGERHMMHEKMFVDGCLDTTKIECPKMAEKVATADANADGCITKEEMMDAKKAMRPEMKNGEKPMPRGDKPMKK
ncbi:MAG: hypothetical protein LBL75_03985 [Rickettsiales bacterium]|jgi:hypothetical protein|nr:hypothetical protein [Rickettsiales bacterium]